MANKKTSKVTAPVTTDPAPTTPDENSVSSASKVVIPDGLTVNLPASLTMDNATMFIKSESSILKMLADNGCSEEGLTTVTSLIQEIGNLNIDRLLWMARQNGNIIVWIADEFLLDLVMNGSDSLFLAKAASEANTMVDSSNYESSEDIHSLIVSAIFEAVSTATQPPKNIASTTGRYERVTPLSPPPVPYHKTHDEAHTPKVSATATTAKNNANTTAPEKCAVPKCTSPQPKPMTRAERFYHDIAMSVIA